MPSRRRRFRRPPGKRRYRKLFLIATEGVKTEPQYFAIFNDPDSVVHVKWLRSKHHSPTHVLKHMEDRLRRENLLASDEAWLVVDKDQWRDEDLAQLHRWSQGADNYGFALSNPRFEYWLLLHFEDGTQIGSSRECSIRLKKYLPGYDKNIDIRKIKPDMIKDAILRAKVRDNPPCVDWPRQFGSTTVYKLVENILNSANTL